MLFVVFCLWNLIVSLFNETEYVDYEDANQRIAHIEKCGIVFHHPIFHYKKKDNTFGVAAKNIQNCIIVVGFYSLF